MSEEKVAELYERLSYCEARLKIEIENYNQIVLKLFNRMQDCANELDFLIPVSMRDARGNKQYYVSLQSVRPIIKTLRRAEG